MSFTAETARENRSFAINKATHIPTIEDATRKVLNSIETLRRAALAAGNISTALTAEAVSAQIADLKSH